MDLSIDLQQMFQDFLRFLPKLITAIITFLVFFILSKFAKKSIRRLLAKNIEDDEMVKLLSKLATWAILIFGTVLALDQVDFNVTGFVAGLGIAGFTIGFALQDITKNFIAGLLLLIRQPFNIGDVVEISDFSGTVQNIDIRDTSIRTQDGDLVILPNADVLANPIKNFSGLKKRRRKIKIGLGYEEDIVRAKKIFLTAIQSVPGVEADPAPSLVSLELGDSALSITAFFWFDQTQTDLFDVHSAVVEAIAQAAKDNHINLPYPIQTIRLDKSS
jgi:small conductance mechanosensitive channel